MINSQFYTIQNHTVNFYQPKRNPMKGLHKMGKKKAKETSFWAKVARRSTYEKIAKSNIETIKTPRNAFIGVVDFHPS